MRVVPRDIVGQSKGYRRLRKSRRRLYPSSRGAKSTNWYNGLTIFVRASDPTEDGMGLLHFLFSERYEKHGNLTTNRHAPDN